MVLLVQNIYVKVFKTCFFSPYQDLGLLGVGKSVPERFSVSMWGRSPIPIEKQFEGSLHIVVQNCYVSDGFISTQDLELGSHDDGSSS